MDDDDDDESFLRISRLRLPGLTKLLYVLRLHGAWVDATRYPGAERLLAADGRIVAATSPSRLLAANVGPGALDAPLLESTLVLDVRAAGHQLVRSPERWSRKTEGTIVYFDGLVWDAAATCDDPRWAEQVSDENGFHALYRSVWEGAEQLPPPEQRQALWRDMADLLREHLLVIDR